AKPLAASKQFIIACARPSKEVSPAPLVRKTIAGAAICSQQRFQPKEDPQMPDSAKNNGKETSLPDTENKNRKVTVMCFFGSDNPLSPLLISQVKAIKDAGWEQDTDVVIRFDPQEASAPTRVYHVNSRRRAVGRKFEG